MYFPKEVKLFLKTLQPNFVRHLQCFGFEITENHCLDVPGLALRLNWIKLGHRDKHKHAMCTPSSCYHDHNALIMLPFIFLLSP